MEARELCEDGVGAEAGEVTLEGPRLEQVLLDLDGGAQECLLEQDALVVQMKVARVDDAVGGPVYHAAPEAEDQGAGVAGASATALTAQCLVASNAAEVCRQWRLLAALARLGVLAQLEQPGDQDGVLQLASCATQSMGSELPRTASE